MSDKNTSTLQSYIDSASGAAQSALGSLVGSNADKVCLVHSTTAQNDTNTLTDRWREQEGRSRHQARRLARRSQHRRLQRLGLWCRRERPQPQRRLVEPDFGLRQGDPRQPHRQRVPEAARCSAEPGGQGTRGQGPTLRPRLWHRRPCLWHRRWCCRWRHRQRGRQGKVPGQARSGKDSTAWC
jgi:hypothetical protein